LKIKNLGIDEGLFNRISEVAQHMPFYNLLGIRITAPPAGYTVPVPAVSGAFPGSQPTPL
jgi:hypothetical protein